jgi:AraC family transcriptional regulator of arabinose operon
MALPVSDRCTGDGRYAVIDRAAEHLRTHIDDDVSVTELAAMSRLSGSHFAALFKSRIGYPALRYQTQLRMARARELLDITDQSIAAVAAATGYPDSLYFARQFKKVHGVTPFGYRGSGRDSTLRCLQHTSGVPL